ncbi:MAG: RNA polymerase sigma factor [Bacteroidota bacterium]
MNSKQRNLHEDVIALCLEGDRSAQHQLYNLYAKAMYNICYRMTKSEDEAADVLQESFISAFDNLKSYKGTASFGAWLKRIVVNKSINHIKSKRMNLVPLEEVEPEAVEVIQDEELYLNIDKIKAGIEQLPDGYRVVFSLYLLEGYDHKEIGEILGITESTSKSQYNRAKAKLRSLLINKIAS